LIVVLAAGVAAAAIAAFSLLGGEPSAQLSTLQVQTHPAGAEVFVQGDRVGVTPLRLDNLASGKLVLELRKQGFDKLTRTVELAPAQVFQLDIDLTSRKVEEHSTPIAPAAAAPAAKPQASDDDTDESATRPSRPDAPSRWEPPRRRRSDDGADTRSSAAASTEPTAAGANAGDIAAPVGGADSANAGTTAAIDDSSGAKPTGGAGVQATERPQASAPSAATSKPASSARPATPAASAPPRGQSRPAVLVDQEAPRFPARARRVGITSGAVTLEYTVDAAGAVRNPRVVSANPPGMFDDAALRAVEKWRYQPKLDAGRPVESRLRFTFRFAE
jgi:TonB family protein